MSLASQLNLLITRIGTEFKNTKALISGNTSGDLSGLATAAKGHLVAAINEVKTDGRFTDARTPTDNSVTYAKQAAEFKVDLTIAGNAIDWSTGVYNEITLGANQTYTFANLQKGKTIIIRMTGAYVPTLPASCELVNGGTYNGAKFNYLVMTCVNAASPKVLLSINTTA